MRYTIDQIKTALRLLKTAGFPNKVIELLGYPSNPMLYHWRDKYPEYYDTPIQNQDRCRSLLKCPRLHPYPPHLFLPSKNVKKALPKLSGMPASPINKERPQFRVNTTAVFFIYVELALCSLLTSITQ